MDMLSVLVLLSRKYLDYASHLDDVPPVISTIESNMFLSNI